ncbi:MAG: 23S rRNA (uracil(1939)-C(5))-methyltransferase RlmD [Firmicutes bacterium]|nr:23S rRNA (uracil(1939)-C(5))-methyltransferase RlmD [Bacillota bacterium]
MEEAERLVQVIAEEWTSNGTVWCCTKEGDRFEVPYLLPGERAQLRIRRMGRKRQVIGEIARTATAAARTQPRCPAFGRCGGCLLQHVAYEEQLQLKRARVIDGLKKAGISFPQVDEVWGMEVPYHYRNKMEFSFTLEGMAGLHARADWQEVVPLHSCSIALPAIEAALAALTAWSKGAGLPGYDRRTQEGLLRHAAVRSSFATGEGMVTLSTQRDDPGLQAALGGLVQLLQAQMPGFCSFYWVIDPQAGDALHLQQRRLLFGQPSIQERLGGLRYTLGPETFFQTNTQQAEHLLALVIDLVQPTPSMQIADLFCGVGTFSLALAQHVQEVIGVEIVPEAVHQAVANAKANGIDNVRFFAGDVRRTFPRVTAGDPPDVVVLDPPRSGAGGKVMRSIGRSGASRIVYVSCNPDSLGTDLAWLLPFGYEIERVQPVDLFPQTPHVESVTSLVRRVLP